MEFQETTFQCCECGHLWTMPAAPDANGTTAPCPCCESNLGSFKVEPDEIETAKRFEQNTRWLRSHE